ncbi:uncharacterized protein L203_104247 [Cryptococcus depauperatus CBS 7841]|uniref:ATP-binding cassette, subfamily B (MDR/TAP), member 1 n=1 Tax=Cryptococcus depauperatus CBS 7841 TaxID=1295531 RepID=A0AAJ8JV28_9TREE
MEYHNSHGSFISPSVSAVSTHHFLKYHTSSSSIAPESAMDPRYSLERPPTPGSQSPPTPSEDVSPRDGLLRLSSSRALQCAIDTDSPRSSGRITHRSPSQTSLQYNRRLAQPVELNLVPVTLHQSNFTPSLSHDGDFPFLDRNSFIQKNSSDLDEEEKVDGLIESSGSEEECEILSGSKLCNGSFRVWENKKERPMSIKSKLEENQSSTECKKALYPYQNAFVSTATNEKYSCHPMPSSTAPSTAPFVFLPVKPRFRRLFAFTQSRDFFCTLLPAIIFSVLSALIQPYMSIVIGDAFAIFAAYPMLASLATQADRAAFKEGVGKTSTKLVVAGILACVFNYFKGVMWTRYGEFVADKLRMRFYNSVQAKSMKWFDMGMGLREEEEGEGKEYDTIGAGGLMTKFNREVDDVRLATSSAFGHVVQNGFTFFLCFILAVVKCPSLAFATLSTVPLIVAIQISTQIASGSLLAAERRFLAEASTIVEHSTASIATVKVHNAQQIEEQRFATLTERSKATVIKQGLVWGLSAGFTDFFLLGTFVLGFWYGAKIVREDRTSSGAVMTCFWAALFSATYLQQIIPHLTALTKGKASMASLLTIIQDESAQPFGGTLPPKTFSNGSTVQKRRNNSQFLIVEVNGPKRCHGEFNFTHVSFVYPSRPNNFVLQNVSLFIPAGETTFIVGGSGSGKSTIAQLLMRFYDPVAGGITMDDQPFSDIETAYIREKISLVHQDCILFDLSVHENIAIGLAPAGVDPKTNVRTPADVTRAEVVEACKMAMIHDFVQSLPLGYDTKLGTGGSSLSGGQRQKIAIARARIRHPTVLILDEATSALDATSRVLVYQNIKAWRKHKSTIVVTHDLTQIVSDDFVYVMDNGIVAEQGFRIDLQKKHDGLFFRMATEQNANPIPVKDIQPQWQKGLDAILNMEPEFEEIVHIGIENGVRPPTPCMGMAMDESGLLYSNVLEEHARRKQFTQLQKQPSKISLTTPEKPLSWEVDQLQQKSSRQRLFKLGSISAVSQLSLVGKKSSIGDRDSLERSSHDINTQWKDESQRKLATGDVLLQSVYPEKNSLGRRSMFTPRHQRTMSERTDDDPRGSLLKYQYDNAHHKKSAYTGPIDLSSRIPSLFSLIKMHFPSLPSKHLLAIGCLGSISQGAMTPIWSFFLAKLMAIVGTGGADISSLTKYGLIILALCATQGFSNCVREYSLVNLSAQWTYLVRNMAFHRLMKQDKTFFDLSPNCPSRLVQILVKDADDAKAILSNVIGKAVTVTTMVGFGILWAMIVQWRLTLIGLALGPLFGCFMALNSWLLEKFETKYKSMRDEIGKAFYESVANIRGIRAMALDGAFHKRFVTNVKMAKRIGDRSAWAIAIGGSVAGGLPLFAQALMNFAGSTFILQGKMDYEQMLQVYNLVLFSLTFGSSLLDFVPTIAKACVAARDFNRIYFLDESTTESRGIFRYPINGKVSFSRVQFSYPSRPGIPVLEDISFTLNPGECVAIVGPSGSGKSTVASLLQKLYVPSDGEILLGDQNLLDADVAWLREHIAVVSQSADLFDATVADNISYGISDLPLTEIYRAAKAANIHDFIMTLPQGYNTRLGENAALISGGQAQRLQIARAICRASKILILDECTSALDPDNAKAILDTILDIKESRTTIFITHSLNAMRRCDRVICLGEGTVQEEGTYDELLKKGGVFAQLMQTGEWE